MPERATKAPGSDGQVSYGGFLLDTGEKKSQLTGATRWVTYDNLLANVTVVAAAVGIWLDLAGSAKWSASPNPKGGLDAVAAAELVQDGLLDARMPTRWRSVVKRQAVKRIRGFSMHAKGWRRDYAGRIVLAELAHRPQWSIERWIKPDESAPWTSVAQRTRTGKEWLIDRDDLFYSVEGALGDDPRGVGLLRHLVEVADIYARYRQLQGIAFDTDCNGIPLGRAPLSKLVQQATMQVGEGGGGLSADDVSGIRAYVLSQTAPIRDLIENRVVTSNRSLLLDSLPYYAEEPDGSRRPAAGTFEWSIETVRQQIGSIPELGKALDELNHALAIVLSAEFLLMGKSGTSGAYGASTDKSSLFTTRIDATLDDLTDDAERDIVSDLLARNGYADERLMPALQHQSVARTSAKAAAEMLKLLADAKLKPGDPVENVLRAREELPAAPEPDEEDLAAWRAAKGGGSVPDVRSEESEDEPANEEPADDDEGEEPGEDAES